MESVRLSEYHEERSKAASITKWKCRAECTTRHGKQPHAPHGTVCVGNLSAHSNEQTEKLKHCEIDSAAERAREKTCGRIVQDIPQSATREVTHMHSELQVHGQ
eukprot:11558701-Prorocentrum_lima.AAC.1